MQSWTACAMHAPAGVWAMKCAARLGRLALDKGEGHLREEWRMRLSTPHLDPLPLSKARGELKRESKPPTGLRRALVAAEQVRRL